MIDVYLSVFGIVFYLILMLLGIDIVQKIKSIYHYQMDNLSEIEIN